MLPRTQDTSRRKWQPGRLGALMYILTLEMTLEMRRVGGFMSWMTDVALDASPVGVERKKDGFYFGFFSLVGSGGGGVGPAPAFTLSDGKISAKELGRKQSSFCFRPRFCPALDLHLNTSRPNWTHEHRRRLDSHHPRGSMSRSGSFSIVFTSSRLVRPSTGGVFEALHFRFGFGFFTSRSTNPVS